MRNERYQDRPGNARFAPCPAAVTAGMAVLIGNLAAVAMDDYNAARGGTNFRFSGTFELTVIGQSTQSPVSGLAVNPGDELFAAGTFDATTRVTYNLTIDKTRGNIPFGALDAGGTAIASGATDAAALVRLKESPHGPPQ